ncbi:MAG: preprotein translocase subunit SecY [Planctomycetota bacterium]|nr:preprotein translocase subunit SecY [Planctomycetota bacterium]
MFSAIANVFRIKELRNKILFTLAMLVVYRIGHWIPLPGVNQAELVAHFEGPPGQQSAIQKAAEFVAIFSGGALSHSTIFGLGIMPYITASIIFQLLGTVMPQLKKLQEEGPTGRQKIMEYTRYATVGLCIFQGIGWLTYIASQNFVFPEWRANPLWWVMAVAALTAGTVFLMWLGEQIDKYGIGNGVSMIIMAGILTQMPSALMWVWDNFEPGASGKMGWLGVISLALGFVIIVAGSVLMTVAQRRIPVQQAKHTRGRKVYGGQRSYLPLRLNHGGVMPIVFASSLMIFPTVIISGVAESVGNLGILTWLKDEFVQGEFLYSLLYVAMVYFFSYFWITVQFNPEEMSKQLKEHGSFIPGLRPGPRTAEYLETVMTRITFVGAAFLSVIAVLPLVVQKSLAISPTVTQFLGGTGLLIVVSVCLDFLQRVEANLLMRNYAGFLSGDDESGGPALRGPRG